MSKKNSRAQIAQVEVIVYNHTATLQIHDASSFYAIPLTAAQLIRMYATIQVALFEMLNGKK